MDELREHATVERADESLLVDYRRSMLVRDGAAVAIAEHGVLIPRRNAKGEPIGFSANPACRVLKDAQHRLSEIRKVLLMGPRDRVELRDNGVIPDLGLEEDDDDDMLDDVD